jgi:hypothetical protein
METKKDYWIEKTLNSTEGLKSVPVSENLKRRLESIPINIRVFDTKIPLKAVWLAAASVAVLLTVNIATIRKVNKNNIQTETTIYANYFSYLDQI